MLDDGAGPASLISDAEWSAGRRSGLRHWPAHSEAAIPGNGDIAVSALAGREVRPAGLDSLLLKGGAPPPWRLPALHPLMGKKEKGKDGRRNVSETTGGRSVGYRVESRKARWKPVIPACSARRPRSGYEPS